MVYSNYSWGEVKAVPLRFSVTEKKTIPGVN